MSADKKKVPGIFGRNDGHPKYKANQLKTNLDVTQCCAYCGKVVKEGHGKYFLFLNNSCEVITKEEGTDYDLGLYPIGSECLKKFREAGVKIYNWDCEEV